MHRKILKDINDEKLRNFVDEAIMMIRETNYELYENLELALYKETYGCHFNDWMLTEAVKNLQNEDGTTGPHWSVEQTTSVAKSNGISFDHFNEYDWNYAMNMVYSDYYGAIPNETINYVRLARKFLEDRDAKEGKAFKYYISMK
ncbi:MAG: hypothetical protein IKF82_01170 [Bacilli bacterium]|nr:hypothetical protein [Bacilli bacterium]